VVLGERKKEVVRGNQPESFLTKAGGTEASEKEDIRVARNVGGKKTGPGRRN